MLTHAAFRSRALLVLALLLGSAGPADAQSAAARLEPGCEYRTCAYNIVPVLHGLRVVRGNEERSVGTLGFLWTRDISAAFDGEGEEVARRAVRTRRQAAIVTDLGLILLAAGAAGAISRDLDDSAAQLMIGGAAGLVLSVPLQFAADRQLARAVWLHNARYAGAAR